MRAAHAEWNERSNANWSAPGENDEMIQFRLESLSDGEERFRSFFERNADAMSLLDPETLRFIEVNEAGAQLLGAPGR
jgi:PAS domain-containing protein